MNDENINDAAETVVLDTPEDSVEAKLAAATARADENFNKYLLAMADFENYKKRVQREIEAVITRNRNSLINRMLPVLDNLERALSFEGSGDGIRGGVEQTLKGFEAMLASEKIKVIDVLGQPFDPRMAEAIGTVDAPAGTQDDTVMHVAQKGYTIGDELLRPAQVIVAKHASA